jgi:hypothetical protein
MDLGTKVARAMIDALERDDDPDQAFEAAGGNDLTVGQFKRVVDLLRDHADQKRREAEQAAKEQAIMAGLPDGITFGEACRIKAAQGDPLAERYADFFNSKPYRLFIALCHAAVERHPGYRHTGKHSFRKIYPAAPDEDELVEWFQKTWPAEARAIEAAIDDAADPAGR